MTHTSSGMQSVLRREIAGTIGLLTDAQDFAAMRRYRSFTFDDHDTYLQQVEKLLVTRGRSGRRTTVALFDPEEYADYCTDTGVEPDTPDSRARFTAELAATGPAVPYDGRPLRLLVDDLVDEAVRQATWEYAATLLAGLGECEDCGEDVGRAAFDEATALVAQILDTAGPGTHHLVCSILTDTGPLVAPLHTAGGPDTGQRGLHPGEALEFTTVLAAGIALKTPGGLVVRTTVPGAQERVYGWRLRAAELLPLTAAEVFDAYCTDAETGDLVAPEPGVDYVVAPELDPPDPPTGHRY